MNAIVAALIAGAVSVSEEVASDAVKDAYNGLKTVIQDVYKIASLKLLEKNTDSEAFKLALEEEVTGASELENDPEVSEKFEALALALSEQPEEAQHVTGLSFKRIKGDNIEIANIVSSGAGVVGEDIVATGDVKIIGIKAGNSS